MLAVAQTEASAPESGSVLAAHVLLFTTLGISLLLVATAVGSRALAGRWPHPALVELDRDRAQLLLLGTAITVVVGLSYLLLRELAG